jgi:hypothetical protein
MVKHVEYGWHHLSIASLPHGLQKIFTVKIVVKMPKLRPKPWKYRPK